MPHFARGEALEELLQVGVFFGFGKQLVEADAVDFVAVVAEIAFYVDG
jgi:hypothetical protein